MNDIHKLTGLVNRPEWDMYMVWLDEKRVSCYERLETCSPEILKGVQGELRMVKEMLTLRKTVNSLNK